MNVDAAERAVLGSMIQGFFPEEVQLRGQDFHHPAHEVVWAACCRVADTGKKPDLAAVRFAIGDESHLPTEAGVFLHDLVMDACIPANVDYHAAVITDEADRRALKAVGQTVQQLADESDRPPAELIEDARGLLDKAPQRGVSTGASWDDMFPRALDAIESGRERGISLPWRDLDSATYGLHPGWVYLVAARPSVGKSVMGQNIAIHVAQQRKAAVFISLEMSQEDLGTRIIADQAEVPLSNLLSNNLSDQEDQRVAQLHSDMSGLPLFVFDKPSQSFAQIRAAVRGVARRRDIGVVVIDYLQLIEVRDPNVNREQQVAEISRKLKVLARELQVPVVALTQLNRGPEQRSDKKPMLSDIRESGAQEQDADVAFLLWRDEKVPWELQVYIGKNRHGALKDVSLNFWGHYARLTSVGAV